MNNFTSFYYKLYSSIILYIFCSIYILNNILWLPLSMLCINSICIIDKHVYEHPNADNPFFIPFQIRHLICKHIPETNVSKTCLEKAKSTFSSYDTYFEQYSMYTTIKDCFLYFKKHFDVVLMIIKDGMIQQGASIITMIANRIGGPIGNIVLGFRPKLSTTNIKHRTMVMSESSPLLSLDSSDDSSDESDESV